jgi:hypothetical protein
VIESMEEGGNYLSNFLFELEDRHDFGLIDGCAFVQFLSEVTDIDPICLSEFCFILIVTAILQSQITLTNLDDAHRSPPCHV